MQVLILVFVSHIYQRERSIFGDNLLFMVMVRRIDDRNDIRSCDETFRAV